MAWGTRAADPPGASSYQGKRRSGNLLKYDTAKGKERRRLVQEEGRVAVEEERSSKTVGMSQQGAWTRWEQAVERKVMWTDLWQAESSS